jgi:hypothetical protein
MALTWQADPNHLLAEGSINLVRDALETGLIVGMHAYFAGGRGPEACGFSDLAAYIQKVEASRPGDWFTIWSVPALAKLNRLLFRRPVPSHEPPGLEGVENWLRSDLSREFLAIGMPEESANPEALFGDLDSFSSLEQLAHRCGTTGEITVLPLTDLVGAGLWTPSFELINAKRPNEKGEVPLGGPY